MARPTLSLTLPTFGSSVPANEWHRLLDLARAVDDAGVDRVLLTDHVVMGEHLDRYPFGDFHFQPDVPWLEPLSSIAAIAAVTRRVRMSTKILIAPLRPAPLLAKTLATIDQLSQGRVEIGVATGWQREEYEASGIEWSRRARLKPMETPVRWRTDCSPAHRLPSRPRRWPCGAAAGHIRPRFVCFWWRYRA